jgi:hypothetical protein
MGQECDDEEERDTSRFFTTESQRLSATSDATFLSIKCCLNSALGPSRSSIVNGRFVKFGRNLKEKDMSERIGEMGKQARKKHSSNESEMDISEGDRHHLNTLKRSRKTRKISCQNLF